MKKIPYYLRSLRPVERNRMWWQSGLPAGTKLAYYPRAALSAARLIATGRREVTYLGRRFAFDNPATLLNIQVYPYEVSRMVLAHITDPAAVKTILDVGGNIGQFALTAAWFLPGAEIDVIEPNPAALTLLRANLEGANARIHPVALTPEPSAELHFEPGRTCTGSLHPGNVGQLWEAAVVPVQTAGDITAVTGRTHYDLVKVDVESAEYEAVRCLAGITVDYMFLELSTANRTLPYRHSEMFALLRDLFGDYDILAQDALDGDDDNWDVMIRFTGKQAG